MIKKKQGPNQKKTIHHKPRLNNEIENIKTSTKQPRKKKKKSRRVKQGKVIHDKLELND